MAKKRVPAVTPEKVVPPPPDVDRKYIVDIFEGVRAATTDEGGADDAKATADPPTR